MATSVCLSPCKAFILLLVLSFSICCPPVSALDFEVGEGTGWEVPPSKNSQYYNQWASKNRFKVDDALVFKYKKDSVMVVSEEDYDRCNSSHPIFFDNKGSTEVTLDRAGAFYFISGNAGHCQLGQKMIVKVLSSAGGPGSSPSPANQTGTSPPGPSDDSGAAGPGHVVSALWWLWPFLLLVGSLFS